MNNKVYEIVNEKILQSLEKGIIPWHRPWNSEHGGMPINAVSGNYYHGSNVWLLTGISLADGLPNYWCTPKQAMGKGWNIKGQHCTAIVTFWKFLEHVDIDSDGKEKKKTIPMLRFFPVLNASQCEGWEKTEPTGQPEIADHPSNYENGPTINHVFDSNKAFYSPSTDTVSLPEKSQFISENHYYATLYHELAHSTGHESRLNRKSPDAIAAFGGESYAKEELVAELGSAYVCMQLHIDNDKLTENTAAYITSWSNALKQEPRMFVSAAGAAEKAANMILGVSNE